ncbi:MAG: hypothetical protein V1855_04680 [bacterium]
MKIFFRFVLYYLFCVIVLLLFPSCISYYKLSKKEFPQGDEFKDKREVTHNYVRGAKVLDQFSTQAIFNSLWLSNQTRTAYVDLYSRRRGKDTNKREAMLKRQLEENKHWMSFYVLTDIREVTQIGMGDKNSCWTMYLEVAKKGAATPVVKLEPISIKEVDIEPEIQEFFGRQRFDSFKSSYLVKFPANGLDGQPYFQDGDTVTLVFGSVRKEARLVWDSSDLKKHGDLLKDEDFYWF